MQIIGHRGCPAHGPENTIRAVRTAAPHVDGVEVDVRRCGSGELVVVHDADLYRVADTDLDVCEASLDRLRAVDVRGTDEPVPTLAAVLDAVPDDVFVNIELKESGLGNDVASAAERVANEVLISSFLPNALRELDGSGHCRALLFKYGWRGRLDQAAEIGCDAIHPQFRLLDEDRIASAHDRGFAVNAWTPSYTRDVAHLREIGVDGVIVDDWQLAE